MNTKQLGLIIGGVVLLALLGAAVFVGSRMLASTQATTADGGGNMGIIRSIGGGPGGAMAKSFRLDIENAPELPATPADVNGLYVRNEDNSYFVGAGNIRMMMSIGQDGGAPQSDFSYDGPIVEVVVTRDTQLYKDVTQHNFDAAQSGELKLQQVLEPADSLDEANESTTLQAWGEQRGDRLVAEIVVYRLPPSFPQ
jgi:hypothetical protein